MKDSRDPTSIGNAIHATMKLQQCDVLEAADWVTARLKESSSLSYPPGMPEVGRISESGPEPARQNGSGEAA